MHHCSLMCLSSFHLDCGSDSQNRFGQIVKAINLYWGKSSHGLRNSEGGNRRMRKEVHIETQKKTEGKNRWGICIMPKWSPGEGDATTCSRPILFFFQQSIVLYNHWIIDIAKSDEELALCLSFCLLHKHKHNRTSCCKMWRDWQDAQLSSMLAKPCQNSQFCQVSVRGKESAKGRVGVGMEGWDPHTWKKGREGTTGWFIQRVRSGWIKL